MNVTTGELYPSLAAAISDAHESDEVVEISGSVDAVANVSNAVKAQRRAANKRARQTRKRNRKR